MGSKSEAKYYDKIVIKVIQASNQFFFIDNIVFFVSWKFVLKNVFGLFTYENFKSEGWGLKFNHFYNAYSESGSNILRMNKKSTVHKKRRKNKLWVLSYTSLSLYSYVSLKLSPQIVTNHLLWYLILF